MWLSEEHCTGAGDLRVHDHAGLAAAANSGAVRGLFVFDTDLLRLSSDRAVVPFSPFLKSIPENLGSVFRPSHFASGNSPQVVSPRVIGATSHEETVCTK